MLGARVAGHVAAVLPGDNTVVRKGDTIFRIDDGDYRIAVDAARTKIATQQATVDRIGRQVTAQESAAIGGSFFTHHFELGLRGAADADGDGQVTLAEAFRCIGEAKNGTDLVAQEQHCDDHEDERGAHHPTQENVGVRNIGCAARGEHAHDCIIKQDADLQQCGASDGVDPERTADLAADLPRERLVEQREERLWPRRGHVARREEIDDEPEPLLRDALELRAILVLRISLIDVDQARDILHHGGR